MTKRKNKVKVPTKQGNYEVGYKRPPKKRRFGEAESNPRHNGSWKKEDTLRFKLQQIAKMTEEELRSLLEAQDAGLYEKQLAKTLLSLGEVDPNKRWQILDGLINQDGGYPKQQVEQHNIELKSILPKLEKRRKK